MTAEAALTRTLDIRFIDARKIVNEAKINLGIRGYPDHFEEELLIQEAIRLYEMSPNVVKQMLRKYKEGFDSMKDHSGRGGSDDSTSFTSSGVDELDDTSRHSCEERKPKRRSLWSFGSH